jgi:ABC-type uncharacterized transport system ATPase subunit
MQQVQSLKITIKNCNSIDHAEIDLTKGSLNIKYGPNGLGKSTIAKAIVSHVRSDGTLNDLIPFKNRGKEGVENPKVEGIDDLKSALVFDEEYVSQFVFQQNEVIKNSFDIFIKTPDYVTTMAEIDELLRALPLRMYIVVLLSPVRRGAMKALYYVFCLPNTFVLTNRVIHAWISQ